MRQTLLALAAVLGTCLPALAVNHEVVVPPIGDGLFAVACSNVAQDPALIAALGSTPEEIWEGKPRDGQGRYISDILAAPLDSLSL